MHLMQMEHLGIVSLGENKMAKHKLKIISYLRLSKAGKAQLGLDVQRDMVKQYTQSHQAKLLEEYIEIESGRRSDRRRPVLRQALEHCKREGAILVVAKIDRLTRNLSFLTRLLESDVRFSVCDFPELGDPAKNKLHLQLMVAFAEFEVETIRTRTRAALQAKKRKGAILGTPNPQAGAKKGGRWARQNANEFAREVGPIMDELEQYGCDTLVKIAKGLQARGIKTAREGTMWHASTVKNVKLRWQKLQKQDAKKAS
jgi:DNA invertase Pin-like site-specific DNA recombinase|tara:strand:- start:838 stop:1608 length:771 start_codon:yes stop_codon:yes gene_type:complete